jgi:SAM-dependent methyltransferase
MLSTMLYTRGGYAAQNPTYHTEDSAFKWRNFEAALRAAGVVLDDVGTVAEIGCGAGQILACAQASGALPRATFHGWDINPEAIERARGLSPELALTCGDLLESSDCSDLVLCADVFEHVEDPFRFLRRLKARGRLFVFNIPLELSLLTLLRGESALRASYEQVGHLHFYTQASALRLLSVCGYDVVTTRFARNRTGRVGQGRPTLRRTLATLPQAVIERVSPAAAAALLGDSLVVVAR